jgi:hypothetical protein
LEVHTTDVRVLDGLKNKEDGFALLRVTPRDGRVLRDPFAAHEKLLVGSMTRVRQLVEVVARIDELDSPERLEFDLGHRRERAVA